MFMIIYNNDADLEVSVTCVRNSLLIGVELDDVPYLAVDQNEVGAAR